MGSFPEVGSQNLNKKDKYLYAIKAEPLEFMKEDVLCVKTEDTTENPYLSIVDGSYKEEAEEFLNKNAGDEEGRTFLSKRDKMETENKTEFDEMFLKKIED